MNRCRALLCGLSLTLLTLPTGSHATSIPRPSGQETFPSIAEAGPNLVIHGSHPSKLEKAGGITLWNIYGGVHPDGLNDRTPEGWFNTVQWIPDTQGWTPVDLTEQPSHWHVSQFNASNLDIAVPNLAMFAGVEAQEPGFTTAPGYGNNVDDWLDWSALTNPTISTSVRLTFDFNYDVEPGYDFVHVEYDSAGVMKTLALFTGSNRDSTGAFTTPAHFDTTLLFTPLMYSNSKVHLRLRVTSDGAWSDEDGLFPSDGAAQIDNIRVFFNGVPVTEHGDGLATFDDLGGGNYDDDGWTPTPSNFVGNFGRVWPRLWDLDPCRDDPTPQIGFVDDGRPPLNSTESTGGSLSPNWSYGVEGGWVVNYQGGLTFGLDALANEFWSPEIAFDDTTTTQDDAINGGLYFRATVWQHLPLLNGMFWVWHVRSYPDQNGNWTSWQDRNFVYYGDNPVYNVIQNDVSDLIVPNVQKVQIALGVVDLASVFGLPGGDATPSPMYDDVSVWKYSSDGPAFTARNIDLFQDSFPNSGVHDWATNKALASVRLDAAIDINPAGTAIVAGDSIAVDIKAVSPGTTITGPGSNGLPVMHWILEANSWFDSVRVLPPGAILVGTNARGFKLWMGTVEGDSARTVNGTAVADRFYFDAPNDGPATQPHHTPEDAMFFPGDVFRWFIEARDSNNLTSTLPADTTGFFSGENYSRIATVRALPSIVDDGQGGFTQPRILVVNDFGHRGGEAEFLHAFRQNGMVEGVDFDTYTVMGPSSLVSNGIGSAGIHGANALQLAGYETIFYFTGNLSSGLISDGSGQGSNDKGDDVSVLTDWHHQAGDRSIVYFGDNIASGMMDQGVVAQTYLNTVMGVDMVFSDARSALQGQTAPYFRPTGSPPGMFTTGLVAYGGCLSINTFDYIQPNNGSGSYAAHEFTDGGPTGTALQPVASIWHERTEAVGTGTYRRVDLTFPFGFLYITDYYPDADQGISGRSAFVAEILNAFGQSSVIGSATGTPRLGPQRLLVEQNHPNPFNPRTTIRFTAPRKGRYQVTVFNQRGEVVRRLFDGTAQAGVTTSVTWDGRDQTGHPSSSGIYLYQVKGEGFTETRKMALIK